MAAALSQANFAVSPLRTEIFEAHQNLSDFIISNIERSNIRLEKQILVVTSKLVSLAEGRLASIHENRKAGLIKSEADLYLGEMNHSCHLTIKHGLFMMTAGIDLSNSKSGDFILLPKDPFKSAQILHADLKLRFCLNEFGVLISDSRTLPLRPGVLGCGLAGFGFQPIKNLIGEKDLFDRPLKMTQLNLIDAIASAAVMMMGEAREQTPLALVSGAPVRFSEENFAADLQLELSEDLYYPMYQDLIAKNNAKKAKE